MMSEILVLTPCLTTLTKIKFWDRSKVVTQEKALSEKSINAKTSTSTQKEVGDLEIVDVLLPQKHRNLNTPNSHFCCLLAKFYLIDIKHLHWSQIQLIFAATIISSHLHKFLCTLHFKHQRMQLQKFGYF